MVLVLYLVTNDTLLQKTKVYFKIRKRLYYKMRRLLQMRQYIHLKYLRSRSRLTLNLRYMQIWDMFNWFCSFSGWWVLRYFSRINLEVWLKLCSFSSREKCPNTDFLFLVCIFLHSDWIRRDTEYLSVFSPNAGKYGPEKILHLDTFHAVNVILKNWSNL